MLTLSKLRASFRPFAAVAASRGASSSAPRRRRRIMGKRKVDSDDELEAEDVEEEVKPKKKRQSSAKKSKFSEPFVDNLGWNVEPPSLIWRSFGDPEGSKKIAAFDMDSTLVNRKSNATFARDANDWKWWNKAAPGKLAELVEDGYKIVIFTNQGAIKSALDGKAKEKVESMVELIYKDLQAKAQDADVPLQCFMAPCMKDGDPCRKPATGMWDHMVQHCNDGIKPDLKSSFFVGDADGGVTAHSDVDKLFAEAVGIPFKTPQDFFGPMDGKASIDRSAIKVAAAAVESGENPNSDLVLKLRDLANQAFEAAKAGNAKLKFKGVAYNNAADALSVFPEQVCDTNLKAVNALKGVGKGTMERVKQYLKTGSVLLPGEEEEAAAAAAAADADADEAKKPLSKQQQEAFAYM